MSSCSLSGDAKSNRMVKMAAKNVHILMPQVKKLLDLHY